MALKEGQRLSAADESVLQVVEELDARGLQCPGPIMRLSQAVERASPGQAVRIQVTDPGFLADIRGWCSSTGNRLAELVTEGGLITATVARQVAAKAEARGASPSAGGSPVLGKQKTIVLFSGDFDKAMAAFVIANGAAAMGSQVTIFATFWGLNVLRRPESVAVRKNLVERMFGWMMPRGAGRLGLSRMNMGGMGLRMIKGIMRRKHVSQLGELIESARAAGVRLVACSMSMDLMGIKREELIDGVEEGGVAMYLDSAERGAVNLFI